MTISSYIMISLCVLIYLIILAVMTKQIAIIKTLPDAFAASILFFLFSLISLIPNYYMSVFFKADIPFLYTGCEAFGTHPDGNNIITYLIMMTLMPIFIYYINTKLNKELN